MIMIQYIHAIDTKVSQNNTCCDSRDQSREETRNLKVSIKNY